MLGPILDGLSQIGSTAEKHTFPPRLNAAEEKHYLNEFHNGTKESRRRAKDVLIERNLRLVAFIVNKYNSYKDSDDLISIGTIGLIKAIISFDPSKNTKLATYASRCIQNEILMYFRSSKKTKNEIFLSEPIGVDKEGNEVTIGDKCAADLTYDIESKVNLRMQLRALAAKIDVLNGREREIIEMRYGLVGGEEVTQREIGKQLGISRSYVSRLEKKALKKLYLAMAE